MSTPVIPLLFPLARFPQRDWTNEANPLSGCGTAVGRGVLRGGGAVVAVGAAPVGVGEAVELLEV